MTGQDLTTCVVCGQSLSEAEQVRLVLGSLIAHDKCRDYVQMAQREASRYAKPSHIHVAFRQGHPVEAYADEQTALDTGLAIVRLSLQ